MAKDRLVKFYWTWGDDPCQEVLFSEDTSYAGRLEFLRTWSPVTTTLEVKTAEYHLLVLDNSGTPGFWLFVF